MDAQVKILGVSVGTTRNGKQYFDVQCSDGQTRRCWDASLSQKINQFANQSGQGPDVTLRFDVTQNGQYTNTSVKACFGPGEMVTADTGNSGSSFGSGGGRGGGGRGAWTPEQTMRVTKLASFEYATTLVGALFSGAGPEAFEQAYELTEEAAKRIYKAARAHEKGGATTTGSMLPQGGQLQPVANDPQGVAGFVNDAAGGNVVQIGAPIAQAQDAAAEAPDTVEWD